MLYEMCSTNKFYSKIFADLFAELASMYIWLNVTFLENYANIMEQYNKVANQAILQKKFNDVAYSLVQFKK